MVYERPKVTVGVYVDRDIYDEVVRLAEATDLARSRIAALAIEAGLPVVRERFRSALESVPAEG